MPDTPMQSGRLKWKGKAVRGEANPRHSADRVSVLLPMLGLNAAPTFTIQGGTLTAVELHGATAVNIPSGVTSIGDNVFMRLTSLRSVLIPNGVTSIGNGAFAECFDLTSVLFLGSLPDCGSDAFKAVAINVNLDSSVECLTQRRREAESAENARNLANTMNYASNLLEAKHHLKGEATNCSGHCDKTTNLQFSQHSLPLCASA